MGAGDHHQLYFGCFGRPCTPFLQSRPDLQPHRYTLSSLQLLVLPAIFFCLSCHCRLSSHPPLPSPPAPQPILFFNAQKMSALASKPSWNKYLLSGLLPHFLQAVSSWWHYAGTSENLGLYLTPASGRYSVNLCWVACRFLLPTCAWGPAFCHLGFLGGVTIFFF